MGRGAMRAAGIGGGPVRAWTMAAAALGLMAGAVPSTARAGDLEYVGQGTRALGRAGAFAARADDPMALTYNPAALVDLADSQVMLNVQNVFYDGCVTREGKYGDQVAQNGTTDRYGDFSTYRDLNYPRVCQNNRINPGLWLAYTRSINADLGIGFGIMTPAAAGHLVWGDGAGSTKEGSLPSPVRYQLIEQDIKLIEPTFGVSARASSWFRLGVSLQWGVVLIKNVSHTVLNGTENPSEDVYSEVTVSDLFVPALIASAHLVPHDNVDVVLYARLSDDVRATGEVAVRTPAYSDSLTRDSNGHVSLNAPQPGYAGVALRYADRRSARIEGARGDAARAENWDIELDITYHMTSKFQAITVDIPSLPRAGLPDGIAFALPHEWNDQVAFKLGGDYNVMPGVLALRAGAHYETSALSGSYMGIDFQPAERLGLHAGGTYRLGALDLSLGYAHIFQETVTVPLNAAAYRQVADSMPAVVNAGTYASHHDVVSLGVVYKLGSVQ